MGRISSSLREVVNQWPDTGLKDILNDLSEKVMNINGGSPGPLWGSFFEGLSEAIEDQEDIDEEL